VLVSAWPGKQEAAQWSENAQALPAGEPWASSALHKHSIRTDRVPHAAETGGRVLKHLCRVDSQP
jgi:hypothetical protein